MPYPSEISPRYDHAAAERTGRGVSGIELATDLANICEVLNQVRWFVRRLATADGRWQPSTAVAQTLEDAREITATAAQTAFPYPNDATIDPATDLVRVYVNGVRIAPSNITPGATTVTIPATTAGDVVVVELFDDEASVRNDLAQTLANFGASLIGVQDALGTLSATTVEGALAELSGEIFNIQQLLGDLSLVIRADGSVDFQNEQSMGGNRLTDVADGVDPQDAVTLAQLQALTAIFSDLSNIFLALSGGTMSGAINMGNNQIVGLAVGTNAGDAVNLSQLTDAVDTLLNTFLPLAGGTMTGDIALGGAHRVVDALDPDQPQDYVTLSFMQNAIATALSSVASGIGGPGTDGNLTEAAFATLSYTPWPSQLDIDNPVTIPVCSLLLCSGAVNITDTLTVDRRVWHDVTNDPHLGTSGPDTFGGSAPLVEPFVPRSGTYPLKAAPTSEAEADAPADHYEIPVPATSRLLPGGASIPVVYGGFGNFDASATEGGGGGGWADGSQPNNTPISNGFRRIFANATNYEDLHRVLRFYVGGNGGSALDPRTGSAGPAGGRGGGSLLVLADGAITLTGSIVASGEAGTTANINSWEVGGGGGGFVCLISLTAIDISAGLIDVGGGDGGLPGGTPPRGGGGGGGEVICIAPSVTGDNTNVDDAGGASNLGIAAAGPGLKTVILPAAQIVQFLRAAGLA